MKLVNFNIEDIKKRISKSDEAAFKSFFYYYYPRLLNYSFVIIKNHESAEDITLEVLHSIWERRSKLCEIDRLESYLYICARNKALDFHKRDSKLINVRFDESHYEEYITHHSPEDHLLNKELFEFIDEAVLGLPEKTRLVYRLIKQDGLKYKEVAEILGISVKTVNNQLLSAVKVIRLKVNAYLSQNEKRSFFRTLKCLLF